MRYCNKIQKLAAVLLAGVLIAVGVDLPAAGDGDPQAPANGVVAQISALPDTYDGLPLVKGTLEDINYTSNALAPEVDTSVTFEGAHPIKVTAAAPILPDGAVAMTYFGKNFSQPVNLSNLKEVELNLWFYGNNPRETMQGVQIILQTNNTDYYSTSLSSSYWSGCPGACRIRVGLDEMMPHHSPDLSKITSVRIRIYGRNGAAESLGFFGISFNAKSKPKVLLTFDDGWQDNYDYAYPILQQRNIEATVYACSDFIIGSNPIYMKVPAVTALYNAGWDIGNHCKAHQDYFDGYPTADMIGYYQTCQDYLLGLGFTRSARFVAYPSGEFDAALIEGLKSMGVLSARTTQLGPNPTPYIDLFKMRQMTIGANTDFGVDDPDSTTNDIKDNIDRAVATGQTLMVMMHRVVPEDQMGDDENSSGDIKTSTYMLAKVADYLVSLGVQTCTMSEWYQETMNTRWLTLADRPAVEAARQAYNALSADAKALVTNYSTLTDAEVKMNQLVSEATPILYDADGNGKVELMDAVTILRHVAGLSLIDAGHLSAADCDSDGEVKLNDAVKILQHIAGLIP